MADILNQFALGFPWTTMDPFLFCVHHNDAYPAGNEQMGPAGSLAGRSIGNDFGGKEGWSMYHGDRVPGFPRHPHRGFETITLARRGYIDHSDSLGAKARFGDGDAQWMTAGSGIVHSEMFPLLQREADNPTELFQIWMNLPSKNKMVSPHFSMLWSPTIPRIQYTDDSGKQTEVVAVAGSPGETRAPSPPPDSWASEEGADVAIWTITMAPGAKWTLPAAQPGTNRCLYFFAGDSLCVGERELTAHCGLKLRPDVAMQLSAGTTETEVLLLQGKPIAEPVAHYGPFVMNTSAEIQQAIADYRRTEYGGWPWPDDGPVHPREETRFAVHVDGRMDRPKD